MTYEEFRQAWDCALSGSRLPMIGPHPEESIDSRSMDRRYTVYVEPVGGQTAEPFHVTATLSFKWDALTTARTSMRDDEVLMELLGHDAIYEMDTQRPMLRIDVELKATLPTGQPLPMPAKESWSSWVDEVMDRLESIEPANDTLLDDEERGAFEVLHWYDVPVAKVSCKPTGDLVLDGVSYSAFQLVHTPRVIDGRVLNPEDGPEDRLAELFRRVRTSLSVWMQALDHLREAK